MTAVVGTTPPHTPPPRLPVRDRATAAREAGAGGAVSPMLTRLAAERATGVLERERGTLYLADGRVVHAESPYAPGMEVLLLTHGTLDPADWREAVERADEGYGAALRLIDSGRVTRAALEICHLGALFDAAYFALAPSSTPGQFRYGTGHWFGALRPVPVEALEREVLRRRTLLQGLWPDPLPDSAPLRRPEPVAMGRLAVGPAAAEPVAVPGLTARRRAVLALVDGVRTAPDIARELGRPTFATLVDVRRLAAAGLLTAPFPPPPPPPPPGPPPAPAPPPSSSPPPLPLPRVNDTDITLLKRLRDALEAL
ncbi:transcriptional regulator [Streptomyces sp. NPDC086091]|uniref:transcriptional regulator n=1 Tax=Streptomyces sp. NPDC086091 TaxID=3365751 RepID=UPI0037FDCC75